jgi:hypothetical protein
LSHFGLGILDWGFWIDIIALMIFYQRDKKLFINEFNALIHLKD